MFACWPLPLENEIRLKTPACFSFFLLWPPRTTFVLTFQIFLRSPVELWSKKEQPLQRHLTRNWPGHLAKQGKLILKIISDRMDCIFKRALLEGYISYANESRGVLFSFSWWLDEQNLSSTDMWMNGSVQGSQWARTLHSTVTFSRRPRSFFTAGSRIIDGSTFH